MAAKPPPLRKLEPRTIQFFRRLAHEWKEDTRNAATIEEIITHPSYLRIIGMGRKAITMILHDLRGGQAPWYPALNSLTPFRPKLEGEDADDATQLRAKWLAWGEKKGLVDPLNPDDTDIQIDNTGKPENPVPAEQLHA